VAQHDQACFRQGTDPTKRQLQLDTEDIVDKNMDLDGDKIASALEVSAYLLRNAYLFCRKSRDDLLINLD